MIANVDSGYSNIAAADGMLSTPSNQQTANPSAQTRNTPVENPVEIGSTAASQPPRQRTVPMTSNRMAGPAT